jgi:hypothetical protein
LKLTGYWTGPVDGQWTDALTAALQAFQTALGVAPTGAVDAATLAASQAELAKLKSATTATTTTATSRTTTAATTPPQTTSTENPTTTAVTTTTT